MIVGENNDVVHWELFIKVTLLVEKLARLCYCEGSRVSLPRCGRCTRFEYRVDVANSREMSQCGVQ